MTFVYWFLIIGAVLVTMALSVTVLKRLPLTTAILYLIIGVILGPIFLGLLQLDLIKQNELILRATEIVLALTLFSAGLKLRTPLSDGRWKLPVQLAFGTLTLTVGAVTLLGHFLLGLPLGAAVILGTIMAPTDPVLAADIEVEDAYDPDRLRFSLTGEAGLNDGSSLPFLMLGLGLLGLHDLGDFGWQWLVIDVVWSIGGGLLIGGLCGTLIGRLVLFLRREHKEAVGLDDFLALGLIAFSFGLALLVNTDGFLAVFAAGLALRRIERKSTGDEEVSASTLAVSTDKEKEELATHPAKAPAYMAQAVLGFNEQLERLAEVGLIILIGGLLSLEYFSLGNILFVLIVFFVIRPATVLLVLSRSEASFTQRALIGWFGVRGIGSLYYLAESVHHKVAPDIIEQLAGLTFVFIALSILMHGISVTPLMKFYAKKDPEAAIAV